MKKNGKIRILIADDHYIVRMGLVALVSTEPDMEVVAEAAGGNEALELFAKHLPDLLLHFTVAVRGDRRSGGGQDHA